MLQLPEAMTTAACALNLLKVTAAREASSAPPTSPARDAAPSGPATTPPAGPPPGGMDLDEEPGQAPPRGPGENGGGGAPGSSGRGNGNASGEDGREKAMACDRGRLLACLSALPRGVIDRIVSLIPVATLGFCMPTVSLTQAAAAARDGARGADGDWEMREADGGD